MFTNPDYVFKGGELVARNGRIQSVPVGTTHVARPEYDDSIDADLDTYFERYMTMRKNRMRVADDEIRDHGRGKLKIYRARRRS